MQPTHAPTFLWILLWLCTSLMANKTVVAAPDTSCQQPSRVSSIPSQTTMIPASRPFFWIESSVETLLALQLRVDLQKGHTGWTSATPSELQRIRAFSRTHSVSFLIRETVTLPLPAPFLPLSSIEQRMISLAQRYPNLVELVNLNQRWQTPKTAEGRSLLALRIHGQKQPPAPAPAVLFDATHHAREVITPLVALEAARILAEEYGKNPDVTRWVNHYEIWIVPVVNPDGYHYVFTQDPFWRKNRRPFSDGSYGVDLNRNYPYLWGYCGSNSSNSQSEIYKGTSPASEPEVQTMLALGQALQPQLYLTFHSYGDEIIRLYVCGQTAEETMIDQLTQQMMNVSGYRSRKASSSGESFEHFYHQYGTLAFLMEVGKSFHPEPAQVPALLVPPQRLWQFILERGMKASMLLQATEHQTQQPLLAQVSLDEIAFQAGEVRHTRRSDGFLAWTLMPGQYRLRVTAPGYEPWQQSITIPPDTAIRVPVSLLRQISDAGSSDSFESTEPSEPIASEISPDAFAHAEAFGPEPPDHPEDAKQTNKPELDLSASTDQSTSAACMPSVPDNALSCESPDLSESMDTVHPQACGCAAESGPVSMWILLLLVGYCWVITNSTRRFLARASGVVDWTKGRFFP